MTKFVLRRLTGTSRGSRSNKMAPETNQSDRISRQEVEDFLQNGIWVLNGGSEEDLPLPFRKEFACKTSNRYNVAAHLEAYKEITKLAFEKMTSPRTYLGLACSTTTILGIGVVEAYLLSKGKSFSPSFLLNYARHQILPSVIWATKPAELVLTSMRRTPKDFLRVFDPKCPSDASAQLRINGLQTSRSILAGFLGISQVFSMVYAFGDATAEYENRLKAGKVGFIGGGAEKVVRLSGRTSDVSDLSLRRFGPQHFLPIFEEPSLVADHVAQHSSDLVLPVFWHVPNNAYGAPSSWGVPPRRGGGGGGGLAPASLAEATFQVSPDWLLPVESPPPSGDEEEEQGRRRRRPRRLLVLEGDASVGEQALALAPEAANDLDPGEASLGFGMLGRLARAQGALRGGDEVVRVLLADGAAPVRSGGGGAAPLRAHLAAAGAADVVVDARRPLVKAVLAWARAAGAEAAAAAAAEAAAAGGGGAAAAGAGGRALYFDTENAAYFRSVAAALAEHGWRVLDPTGVPASEAVPCLVYQASTARTADAVRQRIKHRGAPPRLVCALLDRGTDAPLAALEGELRAAGRLGPEGGLPQVCSARIYDLLFQGVRLLLRAGARPQDVQGAVDRALAATAESVPPGAGRGGGAAAPRHTGGGQQAGS